MKITIELSFWDEGNINKRIINNEALQSGKHINDNLMKANYKEKWIIYININYLQPSLSVYRLEFIPDVQKCISDHTFTNPSMAFLYQTQ